MLALPWGGDVVVSHMPGLARVAHHVEVLMQVYTIYYYYLSCSSVASFFFCFFFLLLLLGEDCLFDRRGRLPFRQERYRLPFGRRGRLPFGRIFPRIFWCGACVKVAVAEFLWSVGCPNQGCESTHRLHLLRHTCPRVPGFQGVRKICILNAGNHGHTHQFSKSGESRSRSWPIMQCPIAQTWESTPKNEQSWRSSRRDRRLWGSFERIDWLYLFLSMG